MLKLIVLSVFMLCVFRVNATDTSISVEIKDNGDDIYVYFINTSSKPISVFESLTLNVCRLKMNYCVSELENESELYFRDGGTSFKTRIIEPYNIYGYVLSKEYFSFKEINLVNVPKKVIFKFFLPEGQVVESNICLINDELNSIDCNEREIIGVR